MRLMRLLFIIFVGGGLGASLLIFLLSNQQEVVLTFVYYETIPLWLSVVVLGAFAIGFLVALIFSSVWVMSARRKVRQLHRRLEEQEQELVSHRNFALSDTPLDALSDSQER